MHTNNFGLRERTRSHIDTAQITSGKSEEVEEAEEDEELEMELQDDKTEAGHLYKHNSKRTTNYHGISRSKKITGHDNTGVGNNVLSIAILWNVLQCIEVLLL